MTCELTRIDKPYGSFWLSFIHVRYFVYSEPFKIFFVKFRSSGNLKQMVDPPVAKSFNEIRDSSEVVEIQLEHIYLIVTVFYVLLGISVFILLLEKIYYRC